MAKKYIFIAVDVQNEFASEGGRYYTPKKSVRFLQKTLFPFLEKNKIRVSEIISDYRSPRPGRRESCCRPGEWGFKSLIPPSLKKKSVWIKCMHSPVWIRKEVDYKKTKPGMPAQNPQKFAKWLLTAVGKPGAAIPVVIGLTIDCCVLSTVQELSWRGYNPIVLKEGVDADTGKAADTDRVLRLVVKNWAKVMSWHELKKTIR